MVAESLPEIASCGEDVGEGEEQQIWRNKHLACAVIQIRDQTVCIDKIFLLHRAGGARHSSGCTTGIRIHQQ